MIYGELNDIIIQIGHEMKFFVEAVWFGEVVVGGKDIDSYLGEMTMH